MRSHLKTTVVALTLAAAGLGAVLPAAAQDKPDAPFDRPMGDREGGFAAMLRQFDTNNDGKVTLDEIQTARQNQAKGLDANNDGKISAEEMANAEMARMRPIIEERAKARVQALDTDGDGLLSAAELAAQPVPMQLFKKLDKDGTGIDLSELKPMPHHGDEPRGPKGHDRDSKRD